MKIMNSYIISNNTEAYELKVRALPHPTPIPHPPGKLLTA